MVPSLGHVDDALRGKDEQQLQRTAELLAPRACAGHGIATVKEES